MSYETIDLDRCDFEKLVRVLLKIKLRGCEVMHVTNSPSLNGFHIIVKCYCKGCRLVFDDPVRFAKDLHRPEYARNVLFQRRRRKVYLFVNGGGGKV